MSGRVREVERGPRTRHLTGHAMHPSARHLDWTRHPIHLCDRMRISNSHAPYGPPLRPTLPTHLCPAPEHPKVELILVPRRGLLPEGLYPVLLGVVVPRAQDVVLVLLEQPEPLPPDELPPLPVLPLLLVEPGPHRGGLLDAVRIRGVVSEECSCALCLSV